MGVSSELHDAACCAHFEQRTNAGSLGTNQRATYSSHSSGILQQAFFATLWLYLHPVFPVARRASRGTSRDLNVKGYSKRFPLEKSWHTRRSNPRLEYSNHKYNIYTAIPFSARRDNFLPPSPTRGTKVYNWRLS